MKFFIFLTTLVSIFGLTTSAIWADPTQEVWTGAVVVPLKNSEATKVGEAKLLQTPQGVLIRLDLSKLTPGTHAFHIHEIGKCDPPTFTSAGGHFSPSGEKHGILNQKGKHAGDLPNIHVPESGTLTIEALATQVSVKEGDNRLFDENGSALVIHTGPDDYHTDPAGAAGARIACGVIAKPATE